MFIFLYRPVYTIFEHGEIQLSYSACVGVGLYLHVGSYISLRCSCLRRGLLCVHSGLTEWNTWLANR